METRVDKFNSAVRGVVTLTLTAGFLYGFIRELLDPGIYANIFGVVVAFWFASRTLTNSNGNGAPKPPTVTAPTEEPK